MIVYVMSGSGQQKEWRMKMEKRLKHYLEYYRRIARGGRDGRGGMGEIPGGDARADPVFSAREADPPDRHGFVCTAGGHVDPGELVYPGTGGIGALSVVFCAADTVYPPLLHIGERGAAVV